MNVPEIFDAVPKLLTPLIAIITVWIAYQQMRTNRIQLNRDLYGPRFEIYKALMNLLSEIITTGNVTDDQLNRFSDKKNEALFLLGEDFHKYLTEIRDKAVDLQTLNSEIDGMREKSDQETMKIHQRAELKKWFDKQVYVSRKWFAKSMGIK